MSAVQKQYSLNLNGSSQYATVANSIISPLSDYTIEIWFKLNAEISSGVYELFRLENNTDKHVIYVQYEYNGGTRRINYQQDKWFIVGYNARYTVNLGTDWHHLAVRMTTKVMQVFLDGIPVGTTATFSSIDYTTGDTAVNNKTRVGAGNTVGTDTIANYSNAEISQVRVWNTSRSQADIVKYMFQKLTGSETNLQAQWRFENAYTDDTANAYTLTATGSPTFSSTPDDVPFTYYLTSGTDNLGSLKLVNASSQYVSITDASQTGLDITGDFTMECWVNLASQPGANLFRPLINKYSAANQMSYRLNYIDNGGTKQFQMQVSSDGTGTNRDIVHYNYTLPVGQWTHIAVTYNSANAAATEFEFFINGISVGNGTSDLDSSVGAIFNSTSAVAIGTGDSGGSMEYFDGLISHVRLFNDRRTASEILSDMLKRSVTDANLQAEWLFEGDLLDQTANNNDLTASGSPNFSPGMPFDAVGARQSFDLGAANSNMSASLVNDLGIVGGAVTLEIWAKPNVAIPDGSEYSFIMVEDAGTSTLYAISYGRSGATRTVYFKRYRQGVAGDAVSYNVDLGVAWNHFALTYDTTNLKGYINGVLVAGPTAYSGNGSGVTADSFAIGNFRGLATGNGQYSSAKLLDARVWSAARTITEIANNYQKRLVGNESNLVGYWRLDNNYVDATTNGRTLTVNNSPVFGHIVGFDGGSASYTSTQTEVITLVSSLVKKPSLPLAEVVTLVSNAIKLPIRTLRERIPLTIEGPNLIYNPGFENDLADAPDGWSNFNSPGNITRGSVNTVKHSGSNSWHIGTTNASTADAGITQNEFSGRPGAITVTPNTKYRISGYIKTALTTGQAHIHIKLFDNAYGNQADYDTDYITGEVDWTLNDYIFTTGASHTKAEVWLAFGSWGAASNGDAWYDDLVLATYTSSDTLTTLRTAIKLLQEAVVLSETFLKSTVKTFGEIVALVETLIKNPKKFFNEAVTVVETFIKKGIKNLSEVITLVEDIIAGTRVFLSERIVVTESFIKNQGRILTERIQIIQMNWRSFARAVATWAQQVGSAAGWTKKSDPDSGWTQEHGDSHD